MKYRLLQIFSILMSAVLACQIGSLGGTPTSEVLFQDDFSNPASGWKAVQAAKGEAGYVEGGYRIYVSSTGSDVWAMPGLKFNDVRIEVDATKIGGADDNRFGVICRAMDANHFYIFMISSDGYYGIGKVKGNDYQLVGMERMQPSETIQRGGASNHIRADCIGKDLTLYVNSQEIAKAQDSDYASGDVGLIAGAYNTPGTDIRFSNFTVLNP